MKHLYAVFTQLILALMAVPVWSQEPESFNRADFELLGPVKTCVIKANYGQETFEFDRAGRLVKSLTRYSETDYDITHYRYADSVLTERRDEVYRDRKFDAQTSIAHFYSRDSLEQQRLLERIVSYDRSFQEQVVFYYGDQGQLERIVRTDAEGVDETIVEYSSFKNEETISYIRNGDLHRSIRTSRKEVPAGIRTTELVKEYLRGEPVRATERTLDADAKVLREVSFDYDPAKETFVPTKTIEFTYNEIGLPESEKTLVHPGVKSNSGTPRQEVRNFVYQMDGSGHGNWIRQVITPQNSFVVRQIEYFEPVQPGGKKDSLQDRP